MSIQLVMVFLILLLVLVVSIKEWVPLGAVGLMIPVLLVAGGINSAREALAYFANSTVIILTCSYIIGAAILDSGIAAYIGHAIQKISSTSRNSERTIICLIVLAVMLLNAMVSRTPVTAALMPIVISIAMAAGISRTRLLLVLGMAANFAGFNTMISTPSNTLSSGFLLDAGYEGFGYFDYSLVGIPVAIAGTALLILFDNRLLPSYIKEDPAHAKDSGAGKPISDSPAWKRHVTVFVMMVFVGGMMLSPVTGISSPVVALLAVGILLSTRVISEKRAATCVGWGTMFFIVGILALGKGMETAGANEVVAGVALRLLGDSPSPWLITSVLFGISAIATQFMSNVGAAGVLFPIALSVAHGIGADPRAAVMAVVFGCGSSFMTPLATPTNAMIMESANLKFKNFVKTGTPIMAATFVFVVTLVPVIWPFFPAQTNI